jgi:hypothetical protein
MSEKLFSETEIREMCRRDFIDADRILQRLWFARLEREYDANSAKIDAMIKASIPSKTYSEVKASLKRGKMIEMIDKLFARNDELMKLMYPNQFKEPEATP